MGGSAIFPTVLGKGQAKDVLVVGLCGDQERSPPVLAAICAINHNEGVPPAGEDVELVIGAIAYTART